MKVLIVDDEINIRESLCKLLELEGMTTVAASDGLQGKAQLQEEAFDAVILDLKMPGMNGQELLAWIRDQGLRLPVIMISALGEIADAVTALKSGANDYLLKPFDPAELLHKLREMVSARKLQDKVELGSRNPEGSRSLVGESPSMIALKALLEKLAWADTTVLITGESGTGKELVARAIHAHSPLADEAFVAVNIGGIHEQLIESELFGHEKGAFTGADARKQGLFELAGNGTLFLDEMGEMPLSLQVKLLRVLQERKIRRLGGTQDIPVKARILSATNRDIEALVREGKFREDLYYRLNVMRVNVPALRERKEDLPLLCGHLLEKIRKRLGKAGKTLSTQALNRLLAYNFPGNIRELENILERAMIYSETDEIGAAELDLRDGYANSAGNQPNQAKLSSTYETQAPVAEVGESLKSIEKAGILRALDKWQGNRTKAALELGISRRTILYKIKEYGIEKEARGGRPSKAHLLR